ncbi:hypothetical protein RD792_015398 [Penstemon davidsonii]|uniref:Aminoalcoholphosphotransferase n=1 Tax=Penstemon davidsonii TaxID=160366 RepID=A0ABR0CSI9_9LAMI|nr:hypothetical protein RD792_015398 [Penstemon davidsonii]
MIRVPPIFLGQETEKEEEWVTSGHTELRHCIDTNTVEWITHYTYRIHVFGHIRFVRIWYCYMANLLLRLMEECFLVMLAFVCSLGFVFGVSFIPVCHILRNFAADIFTSIGFTSSKMGPSCPRTFDAVDGKQARRTNSSSPLGELFDHGCDALGCAFEALAFGSTAMCGRNTFWFWVISAIPFYLATWEYYFSNTLILPAINGPTEGLMLIYLIHFFTAIVGAEWWAQPFGKSISYLSWIPFLNEITMYKAALFLMIIFAVIPTIAFNVNSVQKVVQARKRSMLVALAMVCGVIVWDYLSPTDLMGNYPHLVILGTGLSFGFLVGRMILAHLCDEPKGLKTNMCMSLFYLPFAIANALTARLNDGVPLVDEFWVLLGYFVYAVALYLHFATSVIHEITTALGIYCFRITRKEA